MGRLGKAPPEARFHKELALPDGEFPALFFHQLGGSLEKNQKIKKKILPRWAKCNNVRVMKTNRSLVTAIIAILVASAFVSIAEARRGRGITPPPTASGPTTPPVPTSAE